MAYNAAFYNALRAKPDLQQRRYDEAQTLNIAEKMKQEALDSAQRNQQAISSINQYYNAAGQEMSQMLEQDANRVKDAELKLRQKTVGEIGKFNNDPELFMLMGGDAVMGQYARDLSNLEEFKNGISNKANLIKHITDISAGKIPNMVDVNAGGQQKRVRWDEAVGMFDRGEINKIPYQGSFSMPKVDPNDFLKFEDPELGKTGGKVSKEYFKDYLQAVGGLNDEQVAQITPYYQSKSNPNLTDFRWGRVKPQFSPQEKAYWNAYYKQGNTKEYLFPAFKLNEIINEAAQSPKGTGYGTDAFSGTMFKYPDGTDPNGNPKTIDKKVDRILMNSGGKWQIKFTDNTSEPVNDFETQLLIPYARATGISAPMIDQMVEYYRGLRGSGQQAAPTGGQQQNADPLGIF